MASSSQLVNLGVEAAGGAFSGTVVGIIKQAVPQLSIGDEILTTIVGAVMYWKGSGFVKWFGRGMLVAGISQIISQAISGSAFGLGTIGIVGNPESFHSSKYYNGRVTYENSNPTYKPQPKSQLIAPTIGM